MRILIAEDDPVSRLTLGAMLKKRGHEVLAVNDGAAAWEALQETTHPQLAILDWLMPGLDGLEVCRRVRATEALKGLYLILLTARDGQDHLIEGLQAGANDYVTKPFHPGELNARVNVGVHVVGLQSALEDRVRELEDALGRVQQLQGLLPMCSYCKSIRDDKDYWHRVEEYIADHSGAQLSHGICPNCWSTIVKPEFQKQGIVAPDMAPESASI
jgi:sigma-B regulation protein RsbU (phosphoserine phosphatase)